MQVKAYISVGSNIDPEENIPKALDKLSQHTHVKAVSTFYRTKPIGRPEQSYYLNGVWLIETDILPRKLKFDILRGIEEELGRIRTQDKYAARTIDLDIALYGDKVIEEPDLSIPDPDIRKRNFIAIPLMELNPSLILPDTKEPISSLDIVRKAWELEAVYTFTEYLRERTKT